MGKQTGFDLARHWTRTKRRSVCVSAKRTRVANEGDAIRSTEREGVVGFNAITLGAAFHVWGAAAWHSFGFIRCPTVVKVGNSMYDITGTITVDSYPS